MKSIEDFKAQISARGGLAKTSLFRVIIPSPSAASDSESIMFLTESASFPGRTIGTTDVIFQNNAIKVPSAFSVDDVSMTFFLTNDFYIKKVLDNWQSAVIDRFNYRVNFKSAYTRDIVIQELDMTGKIVYAVRLYNAYPVTINPIDVSSDREEIMKLTVSFTYEDYEELDVSKETGEYSDERNALSFTQGALVDKGIYPEVPKEEVPGI